VSISIEIRVTVEDQGNLQESFLPSVALKRVRISDQKINTTSPTEITKTGFGWFVRTTISTFSVEQQLTPQELELYKAYKKELQWYEDQLHANLPSEDFSRLSADYDRLLRRFNEALGQSAAARAGAP
jgi:hypothetical protein